MNSSDSNPLRRILSTANQWLKKTPERALDEAYEAALKIKSIEDTHFNGGLINDEMGNYSDSVRSLFLRDLNVYLETIKVRLIEFKASNSVVKIVNVASPPNLAIRIDADNRDDDGSEPGSETDAAGDGNGEDAGENNRIQTIDIINEQNIILKKLKFIDEVRTRYQAVNLSKKQASTALTRQASGAATKRSANPFSSGSTSLSNARSDLDSNVSSQAGPIRRLDDELVDRLTRKSSREEAQSFADKTGVVPRSILRTVDRIKRDLDPEAELEVVEEFRESKARTFSAIYFILLLIVVPLLTQQVSKNFVVGPIIDHIRNPQIAIEQIQPLDSERSKEALAEAFANGVFLNTEMDEDALSELQHYHERLEFRMLIGQIPELSKEEIQEKMQEKAIEIYEDYQIQSSDALKNVFADFLSLIAFAIVIMGSQREIAVLKSFIDEVIYGLSDSAKAFIIILLTDIFVGFHSPHGWEIVLESISRHLGLPANRNFIFLFIATFPVILDTVFKYWIFRYLNRISPSAVATYKNMNE
ncbi:MAG: proton extrusion protein PcxA [Cyanobacteria bacterium P01_F01_bin.150]